MEMGYEDKESGNLDRHDPFHSRSPSAGLKRQVPLGIISDHSDPSVSIVIMRKIYQQQGRQVALCGSFGRSKVKLNQLHHRSTFPSAPADNNHGCR